MLINCWSIIKIWGIKMKLKNVSDKVKHFKLKEGWISLQPGESIDLPVGVLDAEEGMKKMNETPEELSEELVKEVSEEPEVHPNYTSGEDMSPDIVDTDPIPKYTKSELKRKLSKKEQIELLKQYGVSDEEIKSLKWENKRVEKLFELQNGKE